MSIELRRQLRAAFLASLVATSLVACGGGGDDDEEDEAVDDEDATGLWLGTFTQAGTPRAFSVIAAPSGQFIGVVAASANAPSRLLVGTGTVTQDIFNATGTVFAPTGATLPNGNATAPLTIAAGRVTTAASMTGNYSAGGETATFSLSFDSKTRRGASLATLSGTYTSTAPNPTQSATLTINNGIATFATGAGCNGDGSFAVIDSTLNMYSWTLNMGACGSQPAYTVAGLATLVDASTGGTSNLLTVFGASAARDRGFGFGGTK